MSCVKTLSKSLPNLVNTMMSTNYADQHFKWIKNALNDCPEASKVGHRSTLHACVCM